MPAKKKSSAKKKATKKKAAKKSTAKPKRTSTSTSASARPGQRQDRDAFARMVSRQPTAELATAVRSLILDVMPRAWEIAWEHQGTAGYGTGPKKMTEHFCWIAASSAHVSLGFYYGAELPDPMGMLEGTGKLMRHVKIIDESQLADPAIREMIERATTHRVPPLIE